MTDMNGVNITVIVPVYNTDKLFFKACISSLVKQTLKKIEILVVDDGSEADTAAYLDEIAETDSRIQVWHKENGGVSSARNFGIEKASGEYITFLDADDWLDTVCLEEAYRLAIRHKADMVGWRFVREYGKRTVEPAVFSGEQLVYSVTQRKQAYPIFDMRVMGYTTMKLYRRSVVGRQRYNESLTNGEDVEFNFRLYKGIQCAVYLNRPYYHYRFVNGSAVRGYHEDLSERYQRTLHAINRDVVAMHSPQMKQAYMDFTAIAYLMICVHYVFSSQNPRSFQEKLQQLKALSRSKPYASMITMAKQLQMPFTRKLAILCAKYRFYYGVWAVMKVKQLLDDVREQSS